MTPTVHALLKARYEAQGSPADGWVFPSGAKQGHLTGDGAKEQHTKALKDSGVAPFVPYVLRHTALTRLGKATNGEPDALAAHVRFDERDVKTEHGLDNEAPADERAGYR
jgi:integrase